MCLSICCAANHISRWSLARSRARSGGSMSAASRAHILAHHSSVPMFEDMTVVHKGMLAGGRLVKGDEKFGLILNENYICPTCQMSRWWRALQRQYAKRHTMHVERMSHSDRDNLPHFKCSKLGL